MLSCHAGARGRGRNCVSDVMVSGLTEVLLTVDAAFGRGRVMMLFAACYDRSCCILISNMLVLG